MLKKIKRNLFLLLLFSVILLPKVLAQNVGNAFGNVGGTLGNTIVGILKMLGTLLWAILNELPEDPIYGKILIVIPIVAIFYGGIKKILGDKENSGTISVSISIITGLITFFAIPKELATAIVTPVGAGALMVFILAGIISVFSTSDTAIGYALRAISNLALLLGLGYLLTITNNEMINTVIGLLAVLVLILFIYNLFKAVGKGKEKITGGEKDVAGKVGEEFGRISTAKDRFKEGYGKGRGEEKESKDKEKSDEEEEVREKEGEEKNKESLKQGRYILKQFIDIRKAYKEILNHSKSLLLICDDSSTEWDIRRGIKVIGEIKATSSKYNGFLSRIKGAEELQSNLNDLSVRISDYLSYINKLYKTKEWNKKKEILKTDKRDNIARGNNVSNILKKILKNIEDLEAIYTNKVDEIKKRIK